MTGATPSESQWERRFKALIGTSSQGIVIHRNLTPIYVNQAFLDIHGFSTASELLEWQDRTRKGRFTDTEHPTRRLRHVRLDGATLWVEVLEEPIDWDDGPALQATFQDVTLQVLAADRAEMQTQMLNDALQTMAEGILMSDRDGVVVLHNRRFLDLLNIADDELPAVPSIRDVLELIAERGHFGDPLDAGGVITEMMGLFEDAAPFLRERSIAGERVARFAGTPRDSGGFVLMISDVTEQKTLELELRRLATTDPLTGLFNRRQFTLLGQRALEEHRQKKADLAVLALDIDHFKAINDTYGHAAGDEALKSVSRVLHAALRGADVIGRLGGEEFGVVLTNTHQQAALSTAERLRRAIELEVVESEGQQIRLTTSIGLTDLQAGDVSLEGLMKRADAALYDAKKSGRNRVIATESPTVAVSA